MRKGIEVRLGPGDREWLEAVIGSANSPQKHVSRARIVLFERRWGRHDGNPAPDRQGQTDDLALAGALLAEGVDGLLHDATRPDGKKPLTASSARSPICRPPSMLISPSTMPAPNSSSGQNPLRPFWPNSTAALYHPFDSSYSHVRLFQ
jgi:hypothetical protein